MITSYSDLLPYVIPELSGCPEPMITQALQRAGRRFCTNTEVWQKELTTMDIVASQTQYGLDPAEVTDAVGAQPEPEVRKISWVKISDAQQEVYTYKLAKYTGAALVSPAQTPQYALEFLEDYVPDTAITAGLVVKVVLIPNWNSSYISDFVLSGYGDAIGSGALVDLMMMPGKPWFNHNRAMFHVDIWDRGIGVAVKDRYTDRDSADLRVVYQDWL
jgi:hypothetical protein